MNPDHVINAIDDAIADTTVGPDAMRSTPGHADTERASEEAVDALRAAWARGPIRYLAPEDMTAEAGIRMPVWITRAAWDDCVAWNEDTDGPMQDQDGRLWDVLWMTRHSLGAEPAPGVFAPVFLYRTPAGGRGWPGHEEALLMAHSRTDEAGRHILISLPEEDPR